MIFILIIATNLIDKNNFIRVKDSVVAIYEDRLIANDLIFEISNSIREKEVALAISDSVFFSNRNKIINENIQFNVLRFEETKLTIDEGKIFKNFKKNLELLTNSESAFIHSKFVNKVPLFKNISVTFPFAPGKTKSTSPSPLISPFPTLPPSLLRMW